MHAPLQRIHSACHGEGCAVSPMLTQENEGKHGVLNEGRVRSRQGDRHEELEDQVFARSSILKDEEKLVTLA